MPTENRSNTEMVSVQATIESLEEAYAGDSALEFMNDAAHLLRQFKSISTLQHEGEPVAVLYANGTVLTKADCGDVFDICCKVETPLYTHADPAEVERLRDALKFYADREHYHFESGNWDTVSGEPQNILWCGDEPDFIEDGSVARAALGCKP